MEKMHIVFDADKCVGCYNCLLACRDEFCSNTWLPYTEAQEEHGEAWIKTTRHERGAPPHTEVAFLTEMCRHCENAACERAFPDCVTRRPDGIVLLKPDKARGNRALTKACPYGAIVWNEELKTAQKCTMCTHLLDSGWTEPRCVQACPLRALSVVRCSDEDFAAFAAKNGLRSRGAEDSGARVVYKNLWKADSVFITGAVCRVTDGIERAVEGAEAALYLNGKLILTAKTDFFGEFKLDRLPKGSGSFTVAITAPDFAGRRLKAEVGDECVDLGVIYLDRN